MSSKRDEFTRTLLNKYLPILSGLTKKYVSRHYPREGINTDKIVSDTILKAQLSIDELMKMRNIKNWLYNTMIELVKAADRDVGAWAAYFDLYDFFLDNSIQRRLPLHLIPKLDETDAEIVTLYYINGISITELARRFELSECAVKSKLLRSRGKLIKLNKKENCC
jgi:RNA polymerase sigma-70 factor (ECF subfamily)